MFWMGGGIHNLILYGEFKLNKDTQIENLHNGVNGIKRIIGFKPSDSNHRAHITVENNYSKSMPLLVDSNNDLEEISNLALDFNVALSKDTHAALMNASNSTNNLVIKNVSYKGQLANDMDDSNITYAGALIGSVESDTSGNNSTITFENVELNDVTIKCSYNGGDESGAENLCGENVGGLIGLTHKGIIIDGVNVQNLTMNANKNVAALIGMANDGDYSIIIKKASIGADNMSTSGDTEEQETGVSISSCDTAGGAIGDMGDKVSLIIGGSDSDQSGLSLNNIALYTTKYAGGIVAHATNSSKKVYDLYRFNSNGTIIENNTRDVCDTAASPSFFGGMFGRLEGNNTTGETGVKIQPPQGTTVENDVARITSNGFYSLGGIAGRVDGEFTIDGADKEAEFWLRNMVGSITGGQSSDTGEHYLGGLVGQINGQSGKASVNIHRVFNKIEHLSSNDSSSKNRVGGIVGHISQPASVDIFNVVSEINDFNIIGSKVVNCYVGGLVGSFAFGSSGSVANLRRVSSIINTMNVDEMCDSGGKGFVGSASMNSVKIKFAQNLLKSYTGKASYNPLIGNYSFLNNESGSILMYTPGITPPDGQMQCEGKSIYWYDISADLDKKYYKCENANESGNNSWKPSETPELTSTKVEGESDEYIYNYNYNDYQMSQPSSHTIKLFYYDNTDDKKKLPFNL